MRRINLFKQKMLPKRTIFKEGDLAFKEGELAFYNRLKLEDNPYSSLDAHNLSLWERGWRAASEKRRTFEKQSTKEPSDINPYMIGYFITGFVSFITCWIYAIVHYGFFLGVGLGWIPSLFIAIIAGAVWPLLVIVLIVMIVFGLYVFER